MSQDQVIATLSAALQHHQAGRLSEAEALYRRLLLASPDLVDAHFNLGVALVQQGRAEQAIASYRKAIELNPTHAQAHYSLGNALRLVGRADEAITAYQQAIACAPEHVEALNNLANLLKDGGRVEESIACFNRALSLKPDLAETHYNLGRALVWAGRFDDAIASYQRAVALKPNAAEYQAHLAGAVREKGQLDEAIACFHRALEANPDQPRIHSALLFTMNYHPQLKAEEIFRAHLQWNQLHAAPLARKIKPHPNSPDPQRCLRIGYVSGDFRDHAVAFFIGPALACHNHQEFEVFCYFTNHLSDKLTTALRGSADHWRDVVALSDEQLAALIRQDSIDILVDLSGHTAHNRLLVFAQKPAPVQITYLGYPNTTGLATIDYRVTDEIADPPGASDDVTTEKLLRLSGCAWCYQPPADAPDVVPLPAAATGQITFGCFNNRMKINADTIALWSELLTQVPDSRLLIKARALRDDSVRHDLAKAFASHGIGDERLVLLRPRGFHDHLATYHQVDIALDTFPYNGTTTTCEAMWMGVPVVSLAGQRHASRVGASLLHAVGLDEMAVTSSQEYVHRAAWLASDIPHLAQLRRELRERMQGSVLTDSHRFTQALENAYRTVWRTWCESAHSQASALQSEDPQALHNLGDVLQGQNRLDEAVVAYQRALAIRPHAPDTLYNLANALRAKGNLAQAIIAYQRTLELRPDHFAAHINLGNSFQDLGQRDQAIACYRQALAIQPDHPIALNNLGNSLREKGLFDEALTCLKRAVELKDDYCEAHYNLGNVLHNTARLPEAVAAYQRALALRPDSSDVLNNLGNVLEDLGRLDEALECYNRASALKPDAAQALSNIGNVMTAMGRLDEALACYRRALDLSPDLSTARSSLLFAMNYHPDLAPDEVFRAHTQWQEHHAAPLAAKMKPHGNSPQPDRRLRIGYVSGDFRQHSVAFFMTSALRSHDHRAFEIYCYYTRASADPVTDSLRKMADHWRDVAMLSDDHLAELIRQDQIDILVDLAGHSAHNRLLTFARKPAPLQVTYLGYPNTTGLAAIDYRLTDALADPPGQTDRYYSEKLIRLPGAFFCYTPDRNAGPVTPLPAAAAGQVTFASFNNFAKVTPEVLKLWARILLAVPQSRLVMVVPDSAEVKGRISTALEAGGVSADRLEFLPRLSVIDYYALHGRVDVALDPFPFNGHTTTCDCLWMGVPVITLAGKTAASRAGVSVLSNLDLQELIADGPDAYVDIAVRLATDPGRLAYWRRQLRPRMQASILTDSKRFTRNLESAYRTIWQSWCVAHQAVLQGLETAFQHHQAGRLQEAQDVYRQYLISNPNVADAHFNLGVALAKQGQAQQALGSYQRAIELEPGHVEAHYSLANALRVLGRRDQAISAYREAIRLNPDHFQAVSNLANLLKDQGQLEQAITHFRRALELNPKLPATHHSLANALASSGHLDEAIQSYRSALALEPAHLNAHFGLANALRDTRRFEEAIAQYQKVIELAPQLPQAHNDLGNVLRDQGKSQEAIAAYGRAIDLNPAFPDAHSNLGTMRAESGRPDEAIACFDKAITLKPDFGAAHSNRALALLVRGELEEGWREYEWRWKCPGFPRRHPQFRQPQWDGSDPAGRTILLHAEQGLGDMIQFARYVPLVAARGSKVILECPRELHRLFRAIQGVARITQFGAPLPPFELHCPFMSLPLAFATTLQTIPGDVPYLLPDAQDVLTWAKRFDESDTRFKVGLVWAGGPKYQYDRTRSLSLAALQPLAELGNVSFYSLQKGQAAAQAKSPPAGMQLIDWTDELQDLADTAALIANLDLVISVDTAVAHLAGAMGRPVWTLLPFVPDWRWMMNREDSPWYPTMRLFRQEAPGDWPGVVARIRSELQAARIRPHTAAQLPPDSAEGHFERGNRLHERGQVEEAIDCYRQALQLNPDFVAAHSNLGMMLAEQGKAPEAIACFDQALALKPDFAEVHVNRGLMLLLLGNMEEGWREYEWRWKWDTFTRRNPAFRQPLWDGMDPAGRAILLHAEQGRGDAIHFARYAPLLAAKGAKVIVQCQPELKRLFAQLSGVSDVVAFSETPPPFDLHCPLLSLPFVFGTALETIPHEVPYLRGDAADVLDWGRRLENRRGLKIGLAWSGSPRYQYNTSRSLTLAAMAPLAKRKNVTFYSLQKGEAAKQANEPPAGMKLIDWTDELKDFADTAALIANLDLVISVDTAVAHLAGAMGKPVWTLLSFVPDWRWLLDRKDSPWYPTMRLFRQKAAGDWDGVIDEAAHSLASFRAKVRKPPKSQRHS